MGKVNTVVAVPKLAQVMTWSGSGSTWVSRARDWPGGQELWLRPITPCEQGNEGQQSGEEGESEMENRERFPTTSFRGRDPNDGARAIGAGGMEWCLKEESTRDQG